ncbi:MAG: protein kinase [Clostridium sp.]|nr:protein kinase [Clostridium sp.]
MSDERIPTMPQTGEERIPTMPQAGEERIPTMPQGDGGLWNASAMPQGNGGLMERVPTMPQTDSGIGERIPTMPQGISGGDGRIATMPQGQSGGDGRIATLPQVQAEEGGRIATLPQGQAGEGGRVATVPQQQMRENNTAGRRLVITSDIRFTGEKGQSFVIESGNVVSADSGESQIYGCHKLVGDERYVARVLISVTPQSEAEKRLTRDKVIQFLDGISAKEDSHILPLIEHGTIDINGKNYYVEVYPFCPEGDLGRRKGEISYAELHDEIVPALNEALHLFHNAGLVHRDVKPDNLYRYKGRIVIGDFGITCDLRADGFATDRYKTGTLGYYAPELMSQAAIKASDYYSFGQTVWTLYSGEMMYRNILRRYKEYGLEEQRNQVNFAMLNNEYYGLDEIGREDAFLEILIRGLLQYDPSGRFNYEQVNRWLQGDKSVSHEIAKFDSKEIFNKSFKYNGKEYWDNNGVHDALAEDWENAKELFYTGALKDFFVAQDFGMASEIDKIVKAYSTVRSENGYKASDEEIDIQNDIGLSRFFMLLDKGATLVWRGTQYQSFAELSAHIMNYFNASDYIKVNNYFTDLLASELLGYWYQYQTLDSESFDKGMADEINNVRMMARSNSDWIKLIAYVAACYLFSENPDTCSYRGCRTLNEIGKHVAETAGDFYKEISGVLTSVFFYGFLFASGYGDHAKYMIQNLQSGKAYQDVEMLFDLFNSEVDDSEIRAEILDCYLKKGPSAYLYWWKNNLDLYTFNSKEAKALKAEIENCAISGKEIQNLRNGFKKLEDLAIKFRGMFNNNLFLVQMGLGKDKNDIVSDKADAFWHYDFLNREAPLGFCAYIEGGNE